MSRVQVDDSSTAITYSGSWQTSSDSRQFGSSSRFTTSSGATATIVFTGDLVRVVCTNPSVPDGTIRAEFILDGKVDSFSRTSHSTAYYDDQFFFRDGLSKDQQHTLVVRNTGTQVPLHIDYFEIRGGNVVSPLQPDPAPGPGPPPTTNPPRPTTETATRTVIQTSVEVVTSTDVLSPSGSSAGPRTSDSSSSRDESASGSHSSRGNSSGSLPASASGTHSGSVTVTAFQIVTTSISGVAVVTTIGPGGKAGSNHQSQSLSTGAIIGIIVGSLLVLAFIGVLIILLLRKRRRDEDRRSMVRQRMARPSADTLPASAPGTVDRHEDDMERQSTEASSVNPPPRLSLQFMRALNEKSRSLGNGPESDTSTNVAPTTAGISAGISGPNPYAPSFRSSYPLTLPEVAPPAYSSVRMSNTPSTREATLVSTRVEGQS